MDARIVFTLHDEIAVEVKCKEKDMVSEIVRGCMEKAFIKICESGKVTIAA